MYLFYRNWYWNDIICIFLMVCGCVELFKLCLKEILLNKDDIYNLFVKFDVKVRWFRINDFIKWNYFLDG